MRSPAGAIQAGWITAVATWPTLNIAAKSTVLRNVPPGLMKAPCPPESTASPAAAVITTSGMLGSYRNELKPKETPL